MAFAGDPEDERARADAPRSAADEDETAVYPGAALPAAYTGDERDPYDDANAPEGALVPAPAEPVAEVVAPPAKPAVLKRKRRELERRRQRALLDLGGLVVEMSRRERMRVDLLKHRSTVVVQLDAELDAIDEAMAARRPVQQATSPAAATTCPRCGANVPPDANFCASCGTSVLPEPGGAAANGSEATVEEPSVRP